MTEWAAKRFWRDVDIASVEAGFEVMLDHRPIRTPARSALVLPTEAMARAVAEEWSAQDETLVPATMPVTRSANSAIDKVRVQKDEVVEAVVAYGETDLLCYRASGPDALVERQSAAWDPLLDWSASLYGHRLKVTEGVMPTKQDPEALAALAGPVRGMDPFQLTAMHDLVALSGSLVIGLAATRGYRAAETLWDLSRVDEIWQSEIWGADSEAEAASTMRRDAFLHADRFLALSRNRER